jgi:hypothetical protein
MNKTGRNKIKKMRPGKCGASLSVETGVENI